MKRIHFGLSLTQIRLLGALGIALLLGATPALAQTQESMSEMEITDAVEDEILFDQAVPLNKIDVSTEGSVVTLEGEVDNLLAKRRAARIAETVRGVAAVVNSIEVDPPEMIGGDTLAMDIENALSRNPATESFEVDVSADNGVVTLTGTVDSWREKNLSETVAAGVRGVTAVINSIDIEYDADRSDPAIEADIQQALRWDTLVDGALIDVEVKGGVVELSGTVGSAAEKTRAEYDAWVAGVVGVSTAGLDVERWARDEDLRGDKYTADVDDSAITAAVESALALDPLTNSFSIATTCENGEVTLRGTVSSLAAKREAAAIARDTVGVDEVDNRLRVRTATGVTEEAIEKDVREALLVDPVVDRYEITVDAIGDTVYLYGSVTSYFEKAEAEYEAASVLGVADVKNHLTVSETMDPMTYDPYLNDVYLYNYTWYNYEPYATAKTDPAITEDIRDEMWWSPFVDSDEVSVTVDNGVATLTGTVDSWLEYDSARENAFEGGATGIINRLVVN